MESELLLLFETAKKAADAVAALDDASDEGENCRLDALKKLKDFPVNYQILVSTQVHFFLTNRFTSIICIFIDIKLYTTSYYLNVPFDF